MQRKDNYLHAMDNPPVQTYPRPPLHQQPNQSYPALQSHAVGPNGNSVMVNGPYLPRPLENTSVPLRSAVPASLPLSGHVRSNSSTPVGDQFRSPTSYHSTTGSTYGSMSNLNRSNSEGQYYRDASNNGYDTSSTVRGMSIPTSDSSQRHSSFGSMNSAKFQSPVSLNTHAVRSTTQPTTSPAQYRSTGPTSYAPPPHTYPAHPNPGQSTYPKHQPFSSLAALPPSIFTLPQTTPPGIQPNCTTSPTALDTQGSHDPALTDSTQMDSPQNEIMPIFGGEGYAQSPSAMADGFAEWLFNPHYSSDSSDRGRHDSLSLGPSAYMDIAGNASANGYQVPTIPPQHAMSVTSILDSALPQTILSEEKRQQLLHVIGSRFNEKDHAAIRKQKETLLQGANGRGDNHVLSLRMMETYIGSYWYHFHPQMPILHRPTFSADRAQNLLLFAVIAIGASCLDKRWGQAATQAAAELANFLAWHLRGELFSEADFRPPAKLWVFQTLLLLEVYEKMYSTRVLHERAHIHHATTLTLMRRGSSLRGRSALDSPPTLRDEKGGKSDSSSPHAVADTPDKWWNHWITNEATRRVAFAAFIIDSTHATMFGHGATMVAHEMRLPLPCDEALWSANSGVEVGRIENSLREAGIKPINFLDGIKQTLSGQSVRTNSFGRSALMAGLLSVSWHMHQRDMQVSSLGPKLGVKVPWRGALTKAFDYWETDFDCAITKPATGASCSPLNNPPGKLDEENIFESRTVLHHLAHMAMHVDIVKCQIFAKAHRLLGRTITPADYNSAQRNIREVWVLKPSARDATFYALRFLSQVLAPDLSIQHHSASPSSRKKTDVVGIGIDQENYSARDDSSLNRPWVLYFAALIVWSYGYALDGPIRNPPTLNTAAERTNDMRAFFKRVADVKGPEELSGLRERNRCMGMLMLLREMLRKCRWELMHEAAGLLGNCIDMLRGVDR